MPDTITLPPTVADLDRLPDRDVLLLAAKWTVDDVGTETEADRELGTAAAGLFTAAAQSCGTEQWPAHFAVTRAAVVLARVAIRQEIEANVEANVEAVSDRG